MSSNSSASKVWFAPFRTRSAEGNKINQLKKIMEIMKISSILKEDDLTAIKLHFGERGNDSYLNPVFARQIVDAVRSAGAKPFLTDTNTLYLGSRKNSVDHLETALEHGYSYATVRAPLIIADGLCSNDFIEFPIQGEFFTKVKLAHDIVEADSMVVLTHFKGHQMTGFGGAIKNLAMGCAPAKGKEDQHAYIHPDISEPDCVGCGTCASHCPEAAISIRDGKAHVDIKSCIGCGECATVCPVSCIKMGDHTDNVQFLKRLAEYGFGAWSQKKGHVAFINFLMNVTPECDCCAWSDAFLIPDVGIFASFDPVALDRACVNMMNAQPGNPNSILDPDSLSPGADKIRGAHIDANWEVQLDHAEKLGMGTQKYELVEI
ncbi:MAG: DUF362 domain-containing protein [Fretibacterium sp.]|nr:DUF362 domain-containing protein [Fretibacterium sp.]